MCFSKLLLTIICISVLACSNLFARIIHIPLEIMTIQEGIDASEDGDTILVSPGEYPTRINFNGMNVVLASNFILDGNENFISQTILSGADHDGSIVSIRSGETASLIGFTLSGANTDFGGAVYCRSSSPILSNLIVEDNNVSRNGGGIYVTQFSNPTISNVIMRRNSAGYVGGGFGCYGGSTPTLINCTITDNRCDHVGGGLHGHNSSMTLENVTVANNRAEHTGGAVYLTQGATANLTDCILWNNQPFEWHLVPGIDGNMTGITVSHSIVMGGFDGLEIWQPADIDWQAGNLDVDPEFTNDMNGDYSLSEDSPAIDAGNPESDFDPDGTRADMGSFYYDNEEGQHVLHVPVAYETIQGAIDEANAGDIVLVQPGEYMENIEIDNGITLASRVLSTGNTDYIASTIIDGNEDGPVILMDMSASTVIGFTARNGLVNQGQAPGGIFVRGNEEDETRPILKHMVVTDNVSENLAGGIACFEAILEDIIVINNRSDGQGVGGIYIGNNVTLRNVQVLNNVGQSGGISSIGGDNIELINVLVANNEATSDGGGIRLWESSPTMTNVTVVGNRAEQDEFGTGLSVLSNSNPTLVNSIIWDNNIVILNHEDQNSSLTASYSDFEGGEDGIEQGQFAELNWGEGNIDADPQFADVENGDYHLTENSPCINSGDPELPDDPDDTRSDMGAFYFHRVIVRESMALLVPEVFETIQGAINAAQDGDTVLISPGRYEENLDFNGKIITVASMFLLTNDAAYIEATIIDGGGEGEVVRFTRQESQFAKLIGLTITNGSSQETGGIFCFNASPTISNCIIYGNDSEIGGAGMFCYQSSPTIKKCTFTDNSTQDGAGGMLCKSASQPTLSNSIFWNNTPEEIVFSDDLDANGIRVYFSDITGGENGIITNFNGNVTWNEGNINDNPMFFNAQENDYCLRENSPCVDAGDPDYLEDLDGSRSDIGALNFHHPIPDNDGILHVPDEYATIQGAINTARDGERVLVEAGEYVENIDFLGKAITVMGNPDNPEEVIIDGNENGSVVTFANAETENAVLYGLTIANGVHDAGGGGIYIENASPTIERCVISENVVDDHGGGVYAEGGEPVFRNCSFIGNSTTANMDGFRRSGGAIYAVGTDITIEECNFADNAAAYGINIYATEGTNLILRNCLFDGIADGFHGEYLLSICVSESEAVIKDCQFINTPRANFFSRSNAEITRCFYSGSFTRGENAPGAAIYATDGSAVNITYSVFEKGDSFDPGSAIATGDWNREVEDSEVIARNCTFANNEGATTIDDVSVINCIFYNNDLTSTHSNIFNYCLLEYEGDDPDEDIEGENNILNEDPLFVDAENGDYHLTEDSPCIDAGDPDRQDRDGTRSDMGAFYFPQERDFTIPFHQGWNTISLNVSPGPAYYSEGEDQGPDVIRMMEQLRIDENSHHVILMKNGRGQFYVPSEDFNGIPFWDLTRGYKVRVDEDVDATWSGELIPPDIDILVHENWNMIAYFPTYELDMSSPDFYGMSPILDHVLIMKDPNGRFAVPIHAFSNMPPLRPTQGYQIKVDANVLLNYPPENGNVMAYAGVEPTTTIIPSASNMSLLIKSVEGLVEFTDATVTAVNFEGRIVGTGKFDKKGRCGLAIWGDDAITEEKEGLYKGESFKLLLTGALEADLMVKSLHIGNGLLFEEDALLAVDLAVSDNTPSDYYLSEGYPNPFNSNVRLRYGLPQEGLVHIQVFDITGRVVETLINREALAGNYHVNWNASDYPSGLYMVKLESGNFSSVRKITLIK